MVGISSSARGWAIWGIVSVSGALALFGCGSPDSGSVGLSLQAKGMKLKSASYRLIGPDGFSKTGSVDVASDTQASTVIDGVPAGEGYRVSLTAADASNSTSPCSGSTGSFNVTAHATTSTQVLLTCQAAAVTGSVLLNGTLNMCPHIDSLSASPTSAAVTLAASASDADHAPGALTYTWTTSDGILLGSSSPNATLSCSGANPVTVSVTVSDGDCNDSASQLVTCPGGTVGSGGAGGGSGVNLSAPTLDRTVNTTTGSQLQFLYTGSSPVQVGVAAGTIDATLAAGLSGSVFDRDTRAPLSGVIVSVLGQTAYGTTTTRADGKYNLVFNGSSNNVTLDFSVAGYLPAQRQMQVSALQQAVVADLALVATPTGPTQVVSLATSDPTARLFQSPVVSDSSGSRRLGVYFPIGTTVTAGGHSVSSASVRATEFTVGSRGVSAMPADLPALSAYTYAVDLSLDEGASAQFSAAIPIYVDNFLSFPTGTPIPVGYYDRTLGQWVPSNAGRVIKVLAVTAGKAVLAVDSTGTAANATALSALGISDQELTQLGAKYAVGSSLWRAQVNHFSVYDLNPSVFPPTGAQPGVPGDPLDTPPPDVCEQAASSSIECETQVLKESVAIAGTPFELEYRSDRVVGRKDRYTLNVPVTPHVLPGPLLRVNAEVTIAGRKFVQSIPPTPDQMMTFTWDGLDAFGRLLQGQQRATVRLGNNYNMVYASTPNFAAASDGNNTGVPTRDPLTLWGSRAYSLGAWDTSGLGLGGWDLSVHHSYDPIGKVLQLGSGVSVVSANIPNVINRVAGNGANSGTSAPDGTLATSARLQPKDVAVGPDGLLYIADLDCIRRVLANGTLDTYAGICGTDSQGDFGDGGPALSARIEPTNLAFGPDGTLFFSEGLRARVRKIARGGSHTITTVTGNGSTAFSGDGGQASAAQVYFPAGLAVAPDGVLYFADGGINRVRRIGLDGVIRTIAGNDPNAIFPTGTNGPALNAALGIPNAVALAPNGSIYVGEFTQVRRIDPDGIIRAFAGSSSASGAGDGGPALDAAVNTPNNLAMGADGSLYISDAELSAVRRVDPQGIITTVAGAPGLAGSAGDGGPATSASLFIPTGIAIGADDTLYVADEHNLTVRRVSAALPGLGISNTLIPSQDGQEIYVFSGGGKHLQTLDAFIRTPTPLYTFGYDATRGLLATVTDVDGNVTTVQRDTNGVVFGIRAPFGQITTVTLGSDGYVSAIANQVPETTRLTYYPGGLLKTKTDPRNNISNYTYDTMGRLQIDADPDSAGGSQTLNYTPLGAGWSVDRTTKLGHTTTYKIETTPLNRQRTITRQDGTVVTQSYAPDGSTILSLPDGTQYTTTTTGDPRFGMLAPVVSTTTHTPGGLTHTETVTRIATLSSSADLLSLTAYSETHLVNGQPFQRSFDPVARIWTSLSPQGRKRFDTFDGHAHHHSAQIDTLLATQFAPDSHGRLGSISTGVRSTTYGYDSTSGFLSSVTDALTRQTTLQTDAVGRVTRATYPDTNFTQLGYDPNGNLNSLTPPGATAHGLDHTAVDLLSLYNPPAVAGVTTAQTSYFYNFDRQPIQTLRPDGLTVGYDYDSKGRLETTTLPTGTITNTYDLITGKLSTIAGPYGETITLGYDGPLSTSTTWAGPVAGSVGRTYDDRFRLVTETINSGTGNAFTYDNDNLITGVGGFTVIRDPKTGLLSTATLGTTLNETMVPDAFGGVASYTAKAGSTTLFAMAITPDNLGRISHKDETIGGTVTGYDYTYDTRGQLTDVKKAGVLVSHYDYDANGNRTKGPNSGAIGTPDGQDRLQTYDGASYAYGANGELQTKTVGTAVTTYTYDVLGNLTSVVLPGAGTTVSYVIDGKGRRVGKKLNGALVKGFLYRDQLGVAAELDATNHVVSIFLHGTKVNVPDIMLHGTKTYRVISDQVGSVRLIVDSSNGVVAQRIDYDEFGRVLSDSSPGFQPFGFAGGLYDGDTGLVRFGARDYDPVVGRWISKDPIRFDGGQANLYVYANNEPINTQDPGGEISQTCIDQITDNCRTACEAAAASHCVPGLLVSACIELCVEVQQGIEAASRGTLCEDTAQCLAQANSATILEWGTYCLQFTGRQRGSCYALAGQSVVARRGWCLFNF